MERRTIAKKTIAILCVLLLGVFLANAWVSDDAFIGLRTIDNFVSGYGPVWNPGERVQTYTAPLWTMFLGALYFVTREPYYTTLAASLLASAAAITVLLRCTGARPSTIVALAAIGLSRAFVDYSSSGLENPLTHLLVALFFTQALEKASLDEQRSSRVLRRLALLAGIATLNRIDTLLLLLPALVVRSARVRPSVALRALAFGFAPFLVWEAFSVVYYGFPLPNTAYAKLATGLTLGESLAQGASYFEASFTNDPLTLACVCAGTTLGVLREGRSLAIGILLYLGYVCWIGGDFMSGRFFSAPFFAAVLLLLRLEPPRLLAGRPMVLVAGVVVLVLGFVARSPTPWAESASTKDDDRWYQTAGIVDERLFYSRWAGLREVFPGPGVADTPRAHAGRAMRALGGSRLHAAMGYFAFYAGPEVYVHDLYALADPLLARLPARRDFPQRVGHWIRLPPSGYFDSLRSAENRVEDAALRAYYADLRLVLRGPLLAPKRLAAIWRVNTSWPLTDGRDEAYLFPSYVVVSAAEVASAKGPASGADRTRPSFGHAGLVVNFGEPVTANTIELGLGADQAFIFYLAGPSGLVQIDQVEAEDVGRSDPRDHRIELGPYAREQGVARLLVLPYEGAGFRLHWLSAR